MWLRTDFLDLQWLYCKWTAGLTAEYGDRRDTYNCMCTNAPLGHSWKYLVQSLVEGPDNYGCTTVLRIRSVFKHRESRETGLIHYLHSPPSMAKGKGSCDLYIYYTPFLLVEGNGKFYWTKATTLRTETIVYVTCLRCNQLPRVQYIICMCVCTCTCKWTLCAF